MRRADFVTPRFQVAVHEAGHAVVAHALEIPITRLQLLKYGYGNHVLGRTYHDSTTAKLEDVGSALIAGNLAELHHFGEVYSNSRSDEDDFYRLYLTELAQHSAIWKAQDLVRQHADHIWFVAKVIDMAGDFSGDRLQKVLSQ